MKIEAASCAPSNFRPGRAGHRPEAIVIHISTNTIASADSWFNSPRSHVSAHYIVGKQGEIHQYVQETDTAFHAGTIVRPTWPLLKSGVNPNYYTIGIEHEGQADDVWPDVQLKTSAELVGEIARRWSIPLDQNHVIRHHQIRADKTCPGSYITMPLLLAAIPPPAQTPAGVTIVQAVSNLNLRAGEPSLRAPTLRVIPAGSRIGVTGSVRGDPVSGNDAWYSVAEGGFVWAGGTNMPIPPKPGA